MCQGRHCCHLLLLIDVDLPFGSSGVCRPSKLFERAEEFSCKMYDQSG